MSSQTGVLRRWKPYLQKIAQNIIHVQHCGENIKEEQGERERGRERKRLGASGQVALHMHETEANGDAEIFHIGQTWTCQSQHQALWQFLKAS